MPTLVFGVPIAKSQAHKRPIHHQCSAPELAHRDGRHTPNLTHQLGQQTEQPEAGVRALQHLVEVDPGTKMWAFSPNHQSTAVAAQALNQADGFFQQANRCGIASLRVEPRPGPRGPSLGCSNRARGMLPLIGPLGGKSRTRKQGPQRSPGSGCRIKCSPIKPFRMPARCMRARSAGSSQTGLGYHFAGIGQLGQQGLDVSEVGGHGAKVAVVDAQADLGGVLLGPSLSPGQLFTIVDFQQDIESQGQCFARKVIQRLTGEAFGNQQDRVGSWAPRASSSCRRSTTKSFRSTGISTEAFTAFKSSSVPPK